MLDMKPTVIQLKRFWSRVRIGEPHECWLWTGAVVAEGYGQLSFKWAGGRRAHRFAWVIAFGPIPEDLLVCHRCDTPPCCNPAHLFVGTPADNSADMAQKGRAGRNGRPPRGRRNPTYARAKLDEHSVDEIRRLYAEGVRSQRDIAIMFGVTQPTIGRVVRGEAWPEVTPSLG